jgi:predicted ArsR family transcriptional regulator
MSTNEDVSTSEERARLQRQARALGNPTRFALFEHVARLHRPVQVAALVEQFGLNHNVIRQHLAKLCEAGLFVEEFAPRSGPGRPALQYRLAPDVAATWGTSSPYEHLALLLLEMAADGLSAREVGRRAGRRAATAVDGRADPLEQLVAEMRRAGVEPRLQHRPAGIELVLDPSSVTRGTTRHRDILCEIHGGLAEGFLEELGGPLKVTGLHIDGSGENHCCTLRLERAAAASS